MRLAGFPLEPDRIEMAKADAARYRTTLSERIKQYNIKDPNALIEIAKIAAANNGYDTSKNIGNFGIKDQSALVEIAKIAVQNDTLGAVANIKNYGIQDQAALVEIAKIAIERNFWCTVETISKWGIQDQAALVEIAKTAAAKDPSRTSEHIQNFGIENPADLVEIAKIAIERDCWYTVHTISKWGIQDQAALVEIAKFAAAKTPWSTSEHIQNFGIENPADLVEIAKIALRKDPSNTLEKIKNYGIHNQASLVEIAKIAAAKDPVGTSEHIHNFGIENPADLVEIAKIAIEKSDPGLFRSAVGGISKWGMQDQAALVEIAKFAAAKDPRSTSEHIQNFGIENPADLVEIAKIAVRKDPYNTLERIKNYGIHDQAALVEIAKFAAAEDPAPTSRHIHNFGIENSADLVKIAKIAIGSGSYCLEVISKWGMQDQAALVEIAKFAAAKDPRLTSEHIKNFGIENPADLVEIARIAIERDCWCTVGTICNWGIQDQAVLVEIAKIAVAKDPRFTSSRIQNFGIENPADLVEIAKIALSKSTFEVLKLISNYGIQDQFALLELAKLAATTDGRATAELIQHLGISDQNALVSIARTTAASNGYATSEFISNFGITDEDDRIEIARTALRKAPSSIAHLRNYNLPMGVLADEIAAVVHSEHSLRNLRHIFKWIAANDFSTFAPTPDDWSSLEPKDKAVHIAEWFSALHKDLTGKATPASEALEVQSEDVIYDALAATIALWDAVDLERYGSRARATLAKLSGYDSIPTTDLSPNACRDLWGVLLTARETVGNDLATLVPVDLSVNQPLALKIVTLASALKGLGGDIPDFPEPINSDEKYRDAERLLLEKVTEAFRTRLSIGESNDPGAVLKLWEKWGGDLTPFAVLAGRYDSNDAWKREIPVLSEIARKCLEGTFHEWRYRREDAQLSMLSDVQLSGWKNNPCQASLLTAASQEKGSAEAAQLENIRNIFETNLLQHIPQEVAEKVRGEPLSKENADALLELSERDFSRLKLEDGVKLIAHTLESDDIEKVRKAIKLTNGAKGALFKGLSDETRKQLSEDFKSLKDATTIKKVADGTQYCVISLVTDHPKLLLMTGDLVQAGSCQNYRTGGYIQTLPGYAIDGNIKLALSYVVKKQVLDNLGVTDYASLSFDPATQSLVVPGVDSRIRLGYAMRREILRVGTVGDAAVCVVERPYLQSHAIGEQIAKHQIEVVAAHLKASGIRLAVEGEEVNCPKSRNPGGVYTDKGGGIKTDTYTINIE